MRTTAIRLLCATTMACGGIGAQAASPAEDIAARAFVAWNNGFNSADVKALASLYAPDAIVLPATHAIVEGVGEIESFFAGLFAKHVTDSTIEPIRVMEAGDSLIVASKWQAHGRDDSGALTTIGGSATHVFKRQPDGSYKLVLQTFN